MSETRYAGHVCFEITVGWQDPMRTLAQERLDADALRSARTTEEKRRLERMIDESRERPVKLASVIVPCTPLPGAIAAACRAALIARIGGEEHWGKFSAHVVSCRMMERSVVLPRPGGEE